MHLIIFQCEICSRVSTVPSSSCESPFGLTCLTPGSNLNSTSINKKKTNQSDVIPMPRICEPISGLSNICRTHPGKPSQPKKFLNRVQSERVEEIDREAERERQRGRDREKERQRKTDRLMGFACKIRFDPSHLIAAEHCQGSALKHLTGCGCKTKGLKNRA